MSRLECYIATDELCRVVRVVGRKHDATLVFQRFRCKSGDAGLRLMAFDDDLEHIYNHEEYKLMFLSLKGGPKSPTDWDFLDRHQNSLVEISGGRQSGNDLEQATVRIVAKQSSARALFTSFSRELKGICQKGVTLNDQLYPTILFHPPVANLTLWTNLDTRAIQAKVISQNH